MPMIGGRPRAVGVSKIAYSVRSPAGLRPMPVYRRGAWAVGVSKIAYSVRSPAGLRPMPVYRRGPWAVGVSKIAPDGPTVSCTDR